MAPTHIRICNVLVCVGGWGGWGALVCVSVCHCEDQLHLLSGQNTWTGAAKVSPIVTPFVSNQHGRFFFDSIEFKFIRLQYCSVA